MLLACNSSIFLSPSTQGAESNLGPFFFAEKNSKPGISSNQSYAYCPDLETQSTEWAWEAAYHSVWEWQPLCVACRTNPITAEKVTTGSTYQSLKLQLGEHVVVLCGQIWGDHKYTSLRLLSSLYTCSTHTCDNSLQHWLWQAFQCIPN